MTALPRSRTAATGTLGRGGRAVVGLLALGLLALGGLLGAGPASATGLAADTTDDTGTTGGTGTTADTPAAEDPVILVAVAGLYWNDVSPSSTPTLWSMISTGSVASLSVGRTSCQTDAWLTLSAGQMVSTAAATPATDEPAEDPEVAAVECPPLPEPTTDAAAGQPASATVPGWAELSTPPDATSTTASHLPPGTVGERLAGTGECTTAVGPGAAVMLADASGAVERYEPDLTSLAEGELATCGVTVIDQGELLDAAAGRSTSLDELDEALRRVVDEAPRDARVIVAGVSANPVGEPGLQVVVDWRPGTTSTRWLHSPSTQKDGIVQLVDVAATVVADAGGDTEGLDGAPLVLGEDRRMDVSRTVENRQYLNVLTSTIPTMYPILVGLLVATLVVTLGLALWVRRSAARRGLTPRPGPRGLRVVTAVTTLVAAAPVAASLASLARWWVWSAPAAALTLALSVSAVVVALVAWGVSRLLPRRPWALPTALAGVTWLVLTVDGATGTTLQQASLLGTSAVVGFTRFYGFNNVTFAVYAVAGLVLAAGVASAAVARGRARLAPWLVVAVGAATVVIDGWPAFGADFGGILALVPAFAMLALLVARVRITWLRVLAVATATVAVVAVVAVIDWLAPGGSSHLGGFVQSLVDGAALDVVGRKAAGAWTTVANPAGAVALVLLALVAVAVLEPARFRLPEVARAYDRWPLLRPLVVALVVVAAVGSVLNDSGVIIGVMVVVVATAMIVPGFTAPTGRVPGAAVHGRGLQRVPTMVVAVGGGLFVVALLATSVVSSGPGRSATTAAQAGGETDAAPSDAIAIDRPLVVVGTTGVSWSDVSQGQTPALTTLLTDGAGAAGLSQPTGAASRCTVGGWVALSAGQLAEVATDRADDGTWVCPDLQVTAPDDGTATGARVDGWDQLEALQVGSGYQARPGALGDALAGAASGTCATAVGPGAAIALADSDGEVARYRELDDAALPGADAFACPLTLVDAGDATAPPFDASLAADDPDAAREARESARVARLAEVDARVASVLEAVPAGTTVLVADLAGTPGARPVLGVALARPSFDGPDQARYLTSAATRTDGVARVLDVPATVLGAAAVPGPPTVQDTPLAWGSPRPADAASTADALADLTTRDHVRRTVYSWFVDAPFYAGLAVAGLCLLLGPRAARATGERARRRWDRARTWARGSALVVASLPAAAFIVSATGWWRFSGQMLAIVVSTVLATAAVAGLGALAPRRPVWAGPGIVAGITFGVLTLDALMGTPLNRASPLGSAPTFGARFYGFGNPTFSVYAVAALVLAAALAQWLVVRGRRWTAVLVVAAIGVVTMIVDVWPTLGADLGGGLVLVPAFAVVGIVASGARVTWLRLLAVGAAGVAAVAAVGLLDYLRPADERSHLGRFVEQVVDGSAFETLLRKAGYALRSVLGGVPVWLTLLVLVLAALVLFASRRLTPRWFARTEDRWPLVRPAVLALWIVCVAGSLVNDFGVRIALIALIPAVPLLTVAALDAALPGTGSDDGEDDGEDDGDDQVEAAADDDPDEISPDEPSRPRNAPAAR
ncbi:hypothetical protein IF650_06880 [Cellulosimicrobium terreum]|nr:hypothetical protein [Cellulosimicrobium terreum]